MRRSDRPLFRLFFLPLLIALCAGSVAQAQPKEKDLRSVEKQIELEEQRRKALEAQSRKLSLETAALRRELIEVARSTQEKEALLTKLEVQLSRLVHEAKAREVSLADQRRRLAGTLGALARLSRNTPQALLVYPGAPTDMVRSALLLRVSVPRIGDRAATLAQEIDSLDQVKKDIAEKLLSLRQANTARTEERNRLRLLLHRKGALRRETEKAFHKNAMRMLDLAAKAQTLRDLIAGLRDESVERKPQVASVPFPSETALAPPRLLEGPPGGLRPFPTRGPLTLPVRGGLVGRYGEPTHFGNTAKGIRLETRPDAQVVTPFDGQVVFAGPFRTYGQILIIEHSGGYYTLLAGLAQIDAVVGQWLLAGEPLGSMATPKGGKPKLYFELRRNGMPINPLPWITAKK